MRDRIAKALLVSALGVPVVACTISTSHDVVIGVRQDAGAPSFGEADAQPPPDAGPTIGQCATNECPAGHATCAHSAFPCTDLQNDDNNCGACGNVCPDLSGSPNINLHATTHCIGGKCTLSCNNIAFLDCNGHVEDGCEASVFTDTTCGSCGVVCPSNHTCAATLGNLGKGCECNIPDSCGACGNVCPPSTEPPPPAEWNADYGCVAAECNKLACLFGFDDCNADLSKPTGNGCETPTLDDPLNCGKCGNKCLVGEGEICEQGACRCPCGAACSQAALDTDVLNCGACGFVCPTGEGGKENHSAAQCKGGVCSLQCAAGWADCDSDSFNGCETNVGSDPMNCGGCGVRCDGVEGQPCIDGVCATKECPIK